MRKMYAWIWYGFVLLELLGLSPLLLGAGVHSVALAQTRYQINYFRSLSTGAIQSATVISITNHSRESCSVEVAWLNHFGGVDCVVPATPVGLPSTGVAIGPDQTMQFCSRPVDTGLGTCTQTCSEPGLANHEGRVEVAIRGTPTPSCLNNLALDGRVYFIKEETVGTAIQREVTGVLNSSITLVPFGGGDPLATGTSSGSGNKGD